MYICFCGPRLSFALVLWGLSLFFRACVVAAVHVFICFCGPRLSFALILWGFLCVCLCACVVAVCFCGPRLSFDLIL